MNIVFSSNNSVLIIWVHPSISDVVLGNLLNSLQLEKIDHGSVTIDFEKFPQTMDEWRLHNLTMKTNVYENSKGTKVLIFDFLIKILFEFVFSFH